MRIAYNFLILAVVCICFLFASCRRIDYYERNTPIAGERWPPDPTGRDGIPNSRIYRENAESLLSQSPKGPKYKSSEGGLG